MLLLLTFVQPIRGFAIHGSLHYTSFRSSGSFRLRTSRPWLEQRTPTNRQKTRRWPIVRTLSDNKDSSLNGKRLTVDDDQDKDDSQQQNEGGHFVQVTFEGKSCDILVRPDETILNAMERSQVTDELCIPSIPHECRKGCCLTCTGRHQEGSNVAAAAAATNNGDENVDNGLSPGIATTMDRQGYVLTCSSYVVGDGIKLDLGRNDDAWTSIYQDRLEGPEMEAISQRARAKLLRLTAEQNVPKWTKETESALEKSGDDSSPQL
eukprot:scaffold71216_cov42-Attheya_sp.AAC.1